MNMAKDELQAAVTKMSWFHQIELPHGITTPGIDQSKLKFGALGLPSDMSGKTVLDIGAWDGYFSFACEQRGAKVLATDHHCWGGKANRKHGFDFAKKVLGSSVGEKVIRVEDLSPSSVGTFDIVLFLGVLYHAADPLGYLKLVRSVTKGYAVIETRVDLLEIDKPALAYYPSASLGGDGTNFFGPNALAVAGMCKDVGFSRVETVSHYHPARMVFHAHV